MISPAVAIFVVCFFFLVSFLAFKTRKLEKKLIVAELHITSAANLIYEISKIITVLQEQGSENNKSIIKLAQFNKHTQDEVAELKTNVDKFVAFTIQQINALYDTKIQNTKTSSVFSSTKKGDKIKPN